MLLGTAMVGGRSRWDRFGVFCFLFGIWDLVYYLTLWAVLGWPEGPFTWDILFLIPLVWAGPVVSAVLVAMSLVAAGFLIMRWVGSGRRPRTPAWIWAGAALAFLLLLGSFLANHGTVRAGGVPQSFPWGLYAPGLVLGWLCFGFAFGPRPKNPPTD
jgi:hypothetical protein